MISPASRSRALTYRQGGGILLSALAENRSHGREDHHCNCGQIRLASLYTHEGDGVMSGREDTGDHIEEPR